MTAVLLINPKTPFNVGSVIRACSIFGVEWLRWTGDRVSTAEGRRKAGSWAKGKNKPRLPREERMKDYLGVDWREDERALDNFIAEGLTPVAVEVRDASESLDEFVHPEHAVYIFGPEDGSIPKGVLTVCHRFVRIPTVNRTPLNLAAAVNVVLYDRHAKERAKRSHGEMTSYAECEAATQWETDGDEAAHRALVREVMEQNGTPVSDWTPTLPGRFSGT